MRRLLTLFALFGAILCSNVYAQSSKSDKLEKQVLFTLGKTEEIIGNEFASNMNFSDFNYMFITYDSKSTLSSLISNGKRLVTANDINVFDIDYPNQNPLSYYYNLDNGYYAVSRGRKTGPYTNIYVYPLDDNNRFRAEKNGVLYRHEPDETILNDKEPIFKSRSGKTTAEFIDNYSKIKLNDKVYDVKYEPGAHDFTIDECVVLDSGEFLYNITYVNADGENIYKSAIIDKKGWRDLAKLNKGKGMSYMDLLSNVKRIVKGKPFFLEDAESVITDKSGKHTMTANWDSDFVDIDGERIYCTAPVYKYYDEGSNSFIWVSMEGKDLTLYSYSLN